MVNGEGNKTQPGKCVIVRCIHLERTYHHGLNLSGYDDIK